LTTAGHLACKNAYATNHIVFAFGKYGIKRLQERTESRDGGGGVVVVAVVLVVMIVIS